MSGGGMQMGDERVPRRPIKMTVLRPANLESAMRPHNMAVKNWAAVKLACKIPAWPEITASGSVGSTFFP